jgi:hypothetical protein
MSRQLSSVAEEKVKALSCEVREGIAKFAKCTALVRVVFAHLHMVTTVNVQFLPGDVIAVCGEECCCFGDFFR